MSGYRLWVNDALTVMVEMWPQEGVVMVSTRPHPTATWGPPTVLREEAA
jgi:hypothetical protein